MKKIQIGLEPVALTEAAPVAVMISIEGGGCRLYTNGVPSDLYAGHLVGSGYQIIVPAGVNIYAARFDGEAAAAIVGPMGV